MKSTLSIDLKSKVPKYVQVVNAITNAIRYGNLKIGEKILSINELSDEYGLSRSTVEKGYNILREKGTIIPIKGKGYYVHNEAIDAPVRVLLLFNKISNYKKQTYHAIIKNLGANAVVDLKIHHFNVKILRSLVEDSLNDYDYIVIMPFFYENPAEALKIIKTIPPHKLIILDKKIQHADLKCGCVYQDFENDIVEALEQALDLLKKYNRLYLVHSAAAQNVPEIVTGYRNFCLQNAFKAQVIPEISVCTTVTKGDAYILIEETDLANLIKICRSNNLQPGKDIGIVSYNETALKEILLDGITVISTDHVKMGETAAGLILSNSKKSIKNPFVLIRRNSL